METFNDDKLPLLETQNSMEDQLLQKKADEEKNLIRYQHQNKIPTHAEKLASILRKPDVNSNKFQD